MKIMHHSSSTLLSSTPIFSTYKPHCVTFFQPTTTKPQTSQLLSSHHDTIVKNKMEKMMNLSSSSTQKFGRRWKEYQGMSNWDGLLDPLDENLRAEILRYGQFIHAAYKSFQFDPSSSNYATCKYPKNTLFERCNLHNTGYKVTKHLRATSGIQLPRWVEKAPTWVSTQSSYIGYVAVCDNKEEIKRLGRRDVVIAYRGTATCLEWLENLHATLTNLPCNMMGNGNNGVKQNEPMVESGFLSLYNSNNSSHKSLRKMVKDEITRILETYVGEPLSLTVTGHSLGAALATLTAYDIKTTFIGLPVTVISFGGPRIGNSSFRQHLDKQRTKVLRIVNSNDIITKIPGFVFDDMDKNNVDVETNTNFKMSDLTRWIQNQIEEAKWVYSEVGKELRLCSSDSPYLRGVNVATCHDLNTYLHLVDGFVSSTCPFKATVAKRFLQN